MLDEEAADRLVLGGERVGVALEEAGEQRGHQGDEEAVGLRGGPVEPLEPRELGRLPARRVEAGHLLEHGCGDVGTAGGDLVALGGAGDVLHEEREPTRLGLHLGQVGRRQPGPDTGGDLAVEADLDFVGPQRQAGAAALIVGRGELADHAGRAGSGLVERQGEARRVGHLARPDRRRLEGAHRGAVRQRARPA